MHPGLSETHALLLKKLVRLCIAIVFVNLHYVFLCRRAEVANANNNGYIFIALFEVLKAHAYTGR